MNEYVFNVEEAAYRFANFINHEAKQRGRELLFRKCPYCGNNTDKTNKFSINLDTGVFNCFRGSCGAHGNMITLSRDFDFRISDEIDRYINRGDYSSRFKVFKDAHRKIESKDKAVEYLKGRGISEEICRKYEITMQNDSENIMAFPFRDENGDLTFIKYRNIEFVKGETKGSKEFCEKNCKPILFGMNHCVDFGTLIITEGQIDSLSIAEAGLNNAVSVPMGKNAFTWIPHVWDWITKFENIIIFGDCEEGKITLSETLSKRFPDKVKIVKVEDYQGYKDANEILQNFGKEAIWKAIQNAESIVPKRYKNMSKVEFVDIEKTETIKTNLFNVDKILTGGFKVGSLVVLSGKRGNGKSTIASYFAVESLAQDYNSFIYSGELPAHFVRNWIDRQIVGTSPLSNGQINQAGGWYNERLWLYDNDFMSDDDDISETNALLKTIEEVITRQNVKFILIDNLMTAMDDVATNDALYQSQRKFVRSLSKMAKKYDVVIVLVAHPRKSTQNFDNDEVSGSSVITDAADVVMSYDKITDNHDPEFGQSDVRELIITKNRLTGKLGKVKLYYSDASRRISEDRNNFERDYISKLPCKSLNAEQEEFPWEN